ncbi:MAG TPA: orotidine-5'-phosphate decarboxylase [Propionibacteriaceae bacterium]|nr:orotidine-5'-phosphate decarboxylase [Propionibacteriaceae bacterium]
MRTPEHAGKEHLISSYGERLWTLMSERGPLCVGVDPHPSLLASWGLAADPQGLERCARGMIEALGGMVPVFKPQSAFFEAYGAAGIAVLERTLADIKGARALSVLDVKRGDIGSTMDAYAAAYLSDGSPLAADAITLSPYLGFGSLDGAIELADRGGRGVYVLALTSNPEGPQVQHARATDGRTVGQIIIDEAAGRNAVRRMPGAILGPVGIVIGATIGETGTDFSGFGGSILAPGIGAQGGTSADLAAVFKDAIRFVLPSTSREVMLAGPTPAGLRAAATRVLGEMKAAIRLR